MKTWLVLASLLSTCVAGCSIDAESNPAPRCDEGTCAAGLTCYRGFCVMSGLPCEDEGVVRDCYTGEATPYNTNIHGSALRG